MKKLRALIALPFSFLTLALYLAMITVSYITLRIEGEE